MKSIQEQIKRMKKIENTMIDFLVKERNIEEEFQNLIEQIKEINILNNKHDLKTFLYLLSNILNNHYRTPNFFSKIEKIFLVFKNEIQNNFSSNELFKIYKKSPRFLLFLFNEKIIEINDDILNRKIRMNDFFIFVVYFYPIKRFTYLFPVKAQEHRIIKDVPENFEEKQQIGENDDLLCKIIREDLIEEFIIYVNKNDYSLTSNIKKSIFETNYFLIKNEETTLIEYAAFFGSTQIFKYLYKNGVELTSSLWLYGIHSDNAEMILLLVENQVKPPYNSYEKCIKESIKCHHNDITNYIINNFINEDIENIDKINFEQNYKNNIYSYCFHYYNFQYFPEEIKNKIIFYYGCRYDYFKIVECFLKTVKIDINEKIISNI